MDSFKAEYLPPHGGLKENHGIPFIVLRPEPCSTGRQVFRASATITCVVLKAAVIK